MPPIQFERFVLPDGRKENMTVDVGPDAYLKAEKIVADGFVFQCEQLRTGEWSFAINDPEQGDVAIEVDYGNILGHTASVEKLILGFDV